MIHRKPIAAILIGTAALISISLSNHGHGYSLDPSWWWKGHFDAGSRSRNRLDTGRKPQKQPLKIQALQFQRRSHYHKTQATNVGATAPNRKECPALGFLGRPQTLGRSRNVLLWFTFWLPVGDHEDSRAVVRNAVRAVRLSSLYQIERARCQRPCVFPPAANDGV